MEMLLLRQQTRMHGDLQWPNTDKVKGSQVTTIKGSIDNKTRVTKKAGRQKQEVKEMRLWIKPVTEKQNHASRQSHRAAGHCCAALCSRRARTVTLSGRNLKPIATLSDCLHSSQWGLPLMGIKWEEMMNHPSAWLSHSLTELSCKWCRLTAATGLTTALRWQKHSGTALVNDPGITYG